MKNLVLGIDIGGTNTALGLVDRNGICVTEKSFPTKQGNDFDDYYTILKHHIKNLIDLHKDQEVVGIGVGAPNANFYTGCIENPPNLNWNKSVNLKHILENDFKIPTFITNDANAAAIGEMLYGNGQRMKNFVMVTLGTGLGSGFIVNGDLMYGHTGHAGELGHTCVIDNGRQCACGKKGCLETYVSATGIVRTAIEMLVNSSSKSELRKFKTEDIDSKLIFEMAAKGDKLALKIFEFTGNLLGISLANVVAITSPEAIFLFGGLSKAGNFILDSTQKSFDKNVLSAFKDTVKITLSGLDNSNAAVVGAAALCWEKIKI